MKKLDFKIFRFDSKSDYEFYYKPYVYQNTFSTLKDLLNQVKKDDIYFDFDEKDSYLMVNEFYFKLDDKIEQIIQKCSNEFVIEPLSTKYAIKDLITNDEKFLKIFDMFKPFVDKKDFNLYKSLKVYYYSSAILKYNDDYIGDSALIFAYEMIKLHGNHKYNLLELISNPENGILNHVENKFFNEHEEKILELKKMLIKYELLKQIWGQYETYKTFKTLRLYKW